MTNGTIAMCVAVATLATKISDAVSSRCASLRARFCAGGTLARPRKGPGPAGKGSGGPSRSVRPMCAPGLSLTIDPVTTMRIEDVVKELRREITVILVTNLVQQARRLADRTMFLWNGDIIEIDESDVMFSETPRSQKTYEYVNGIFG